MKFSFGICTNRNGIENCANTIKGIVDQNIRECDYEIIVIGGNLDALRLWVHDSGRRNIRILEFNETQKPKPWITRKKNILVQEAQFENIVLMHDYFELQPHWYDEWIIYGNDWDVAMNRVLNPNGSRHADWVLDSYLLWSYFPEMKDNYDVGLPYNMNMTPIQYISGGFWLAKTEFMKKYPLNENLMWSEAEDIYWSRTVREHTEFKMNNRSIVKLLKNGKWETKEMSKELRDKMWNKYQQLKEQNNGN